ncbi:Potassium channel [Massospora cicadina]|nr:Potassium channel [Massospora cicadina]
MEIRRANGGSYYDDLELTPKTVNGSSRLYLLLVATTTFLGPLFGLASFSGGWFINTDDIPQGFNPHFLFTIASIPTGSAKLPPGYPSLDDGPRFVDLTAGNHPVMAKVLATAATVIAAYVLSLVANLTFPLKMVGAWKIRTSCFPMFIYLFQGNLGVGFNQPNRHPTPRRAHQFHASQLPDVPQTQILYSTSYYAAIISCALSFVSAVLLGVDFVVLSDRFKNRKDVGLSPTVMVLASCLALPSLWCHFGAFAYYLLERWPPILGFYFSLATITTIGFGDFRAESAEGKTFLFFHTFIGIIIMVGLATAVKGAFKDIFRSGRAERIRRKSLGLQVNPTFDSLTKGGLGGRPPALDLGTLRAHFLIAGVNFLFLWTLGAGIFMHLEAWGYFSALYFSFVTFSTIGYGDIVLKTYPGLLAFACNAVYGMVAMSYFISVVAECWVQKFARRSSIIDDKWWDKLNRTPPTWTGLGLNSMFNAATLAECAERPRPARYARFHKRKPQKAPQPEDRLERFDLPTPLPSPPLSRPLGRLTRAPPSN